MKTQIKNETEKKPLKKAKLKPNVNTTKIDSLKLFLPRYKVEIVDPTFLETYQKIYVENGLLDEHINLDSHKVSEINGVKTRVAVANYRIGKTSQEMITLQANSKMLQEQYFEGITIQTIERIYKYLMDLEIIHLTWDQFLDCNVSDIDFCKDFYCSPQAMVFGNKEIFSRVLPTHLKYVDRPFASTSEGTYVNVGLQFNSREKATPAKSFTKFYHKTIELTYKSFKFAQAYLQEIDFQNIGRIEWQLKNAEHKKYLNLEFQTLRDLLFLPQDQVEIITHELETSFTNYLKKVDKIRISRDLKPQERLILFYIEKLIQKGAGYDAIYEALELFENRNEKSRMKKKLKTLLNHVQDDKEIIINQETQDYLKQLKLDW